MDRKWAGEARADESASFVDEQGEENQEPPAFAGVGGQSRYRRRTENVAVRMMRSEGGEAKLRRGPR